MKPYSMTNGLHKLSSLGLIKAFHMALGWFVLMGRIELAPLSSFIIMDMNRL